MAFDEKRYLDLTGLTTYDDDIKAWSNSVRQAGYKTVKRSASGNNLLFFKKPNAIVGTDVADESIDLSDAEAAIKLAALAVLVGAVWDGTNQRWVPSPSFDSSISATTIVSALNEVISDFDTKIGTIPATSSATNVIEYIAEQINLTNDFDILTNRPVKEVTPMSDVIYPLPSGGGGGTATLAGLADTTISNPSNDQILKYDATTSKWINAENSGGGGTDYTAGDGIVIDEDEISTDNATSEDMEEIITPLPSVMSRRFKYSTTEQVVGEWIDGKPVYQTTFTVTSSSAEGEQEVLLSTYGITNVAEIISASIIAHPVTGDVALNYFVSIGDCFKWYMSAGNTKLIFSHYGTWTESIPVKVTFQYTKTTD